VTSLTEHALKTYDTTVALIIDRLFQCLFYTLSGTLEINLM